MHQITVRNIAIDIVRKDIKNLHLAVYPPIGRVRIATPLKIDDETVRLFAVSKLTWIKKQKMKFEEQERQTEREFISGESHYFKGIRYLLNVIHQKSSSQVKIRNKKYIDLYVRKDTNLDRRQRVITEWYRKQLKKQILPLIEKWQKRTGIKVRDWRVKQMKTKWGTCNKEAGRIWLNLELVKKPEHCLEYIIVHEMVHLLERHHNDKFTAYMNKFMPQWPSYKEELNRFILNHEKWDY
ncbi:MAG: SprT family zinc-dependent metalloprotease [Planctomycetota bacterium]